jgi:hypothetical protein
LQQAKDDKWFERENKYPAETKSMEEKCKETSAEKHEGFVAEVGKAEKSSIAPCQKGRGTPGRGDREDSLLIEQMKVELRKLYGEKANLINTNYIVKPQEFNAMAKVLESQLWGVQSAKKIESVDDLLFAVDSVCNAQREESCGCKEAMSLEEIKEMRRSGVYSRVKEILEREQRDLKSPWEEREKGLRREIREMEKSREEYIAELYTSLRYVSSALRQMVNDSSPGSRSSPSESIVAEEVSELVSIKNDMEALLTRAKIKSVKDLIQDREERETRLVRIRETLGLFAGEDLLEGIARIKKNEARALEMEISSRERSLEYEKRHREEETGKLRLRLVDLEIENKKLKRIVKEKNELADEVGERTDNLQEGLQSIRKALEEEGRQNRKEREEFEEVKKKLIHRNKELSGVVRELVKRIKREKKDLEIIEETKEDLKEMIL